MIKKISNNIAVLLNEIDRKHVTFFCPRKKEKGRIERLSKSNCYQSQ